MKTRHRAVLAALVLCATAACSFLRSLDDYEAEFGRPDGGGGDASPPSDAAFADQGAPDAARPNVTCELFEMGAFGPQSADFLHSLSVSADAVYVAAGTIAPEDGGLPTGTTAAVVRIDKATSELEPIVDDLRYVGACRALDGGVVCGVGNDIVAYSADGGTSVVLGSTSGRVDDLCVGKGGVVAAVSEPLDGGVANFSLYDVVAGSGTPKQRNRLRATLGEPLRIVCDDDFVFASMTNALGNPALRSITNDEKLGLRCFVIATGLSRPIVHLGATGGRLYVLGSNRQLAVSSGAPSDCDQAVTFLPGTWLALGADDRFVFLRAADAVELRWSDAPDAPPACRVPLGDAGVATSTPAGQVTQTVAFDGDDVYFVNGRHVKRLRLTIAKPQ